MSCVFVLSLKERIQKVENSKDDKNAKIEVTIDRGCLPGYLIIGTAAFLSGVICGWSVTRQAYLESDGPEIDDSNINPKPQDETVKSE